MLDMDLEEVDLVKSARDDPEALAELVRRYAARAYRWGRALTGDEQDVQDILQEAFLPASARGGGVVLRVSVREGGTLLNNNQTAWNRHARRYFMSDSLPLDTVDYCGRDFPTDSDLHLIGDPKGLQVLELGSGACNCGIALVKQGADVTCLDFSEEQLAIGRECADRIGVPINLIKGDMSNLSPFADNSFDLVLSICAIMYVEDLQALFREVSRVLRPGGRMVFSVDHAVILAIGATDLWPEEGADPRYDYRGPVTWKWRKEDDFSFTTYRRPVSDYVNELAAAGLQVYRMYELYPKGDAEWDEPEKSIRNRFPSVLVVAARKQTVGKIQ